GSGPNGAASKSKKVINRKGNRTEIIVGDYGTKIA
ncbi:unnamed protein product, partial [marine sediment metagenome]